MQPGAEPLETSAANFGPAGASFRFEIDERGAWWLSPIPDGHEIGILAVPVSDLDGLDDSFDYDLALTVK